MDGTPTGTAGGNLRRGRPIRKKSALALAGVVLVVVAAIAIWAGLKTKQSPKSHPGASLAGIRVAPPTSRRVPTPGSTLHKGINITPPGYPDPAADETPAAGSFDCQSPGDASALCMSSSLAAVNAGRAAERIAPMQLPSDYATLSVSEQLFVVANLERVGRGLPPMQGLTSQLNGLAATGAQTNADPLGASIDQSWASNFASGTVNVLQADFVWMYADGYGSVNIDCRSPGAPGCWGHRHDVLYGFQSSSGSCLAMGAAFSGPLKFAEILAQPRSSACTGYAYTWSQAQGAIASSSPGPSPLPSSGSTPVIPSGTGYRFVASDGGIFDFGAAAFEGSSAGGASAPIVGMAATADGHGYWVLGRGGSVSAFGDAASYGSAPPTTAVGIVPTPDGRGYWIADSKGDVYNFGDAQSFGSAGSKSLAAPIVGMATTADGQGYWLVASDGGIFTFGDAGFYGSAGAVRLARPIVGMASTPSGHGYWFVASDGGIFTYGDASFHGSAGAIPLAAPIVGMAATPDGQGYWLVASDGGIFTYGDAPFFGSAGAIHLARPIVGMTG